MTPTSWHGPSAKPGLLRRVAAGERANDPDLNWPNIIEEIESSGRNDIRVRTVMDWFSRRV